METEAFDRVKEEIDLVDYLVEHLEMDLSEETGDKFLGLCPFHSETTPSFHVYPERDGYRTFHCFGCSANGSIIDAVMEKESHRQPMEALIWLDRHYGMGLELDEEGFAALRERLEANENKSKAARAQLSQDDAVGKAATRYLKNSRRLDDETIAAFELGVDTERVRRGRLNIPFYDHAGSMVSTVSRALFDTSKCANPVCRLVVTAKQMGNARTEWQRWAKAEMAAGRDPKREDAPMPMWDRCPHCNAPGDVAKVGWLSQQFPKYRFEQGFDARKYLYNEYAARGALMEDYKKKRDEVQGIFIVEGYGDVWAAHQAGHPVTVAYNGSSFKTEQLHKVVSLYQDADETRPVVLVPDFDETGMLKAPINIRDLWRVSSTMQVKVISHLPDKVDGTPCKDLGDVLTHHGAEELDRVLRENAMSAYQWLITRILSARNKATGEPLYDREAQSRMIAQVLHNVHYEIDVEPMVESISEAWGGMGIDQVRGFIKSELRGQGSASSMSIAADIDNLREAAIEYLKDKFVIKHGFPVLDRELPGGGARLRQLAMFIGKSGTGKTMLCLQMLMNMAHQNIRCVFFTLEQPRAQIYLRMVSQVLGVGKQEAERLVETNDGLLDEIKELYKDLIVIDNVPSDPTLDAEEMTVGKIARTINDLNVQHYSEPVQVIAVDHLGQMDIDTDLAPKDVAASDTMAPGYIMQEMAKVTKALNIYTIMLNQLPKNVPEGVEFPYDAGRGGSKQTDNCDYIYCIWRPDREHGIPPDEVLRRQGQYMLRLSKNRHGASKTAFCKFEGETGRIVPDEDWQMRFDIVDEAFDRENDDGEGPQGEGQDGEYAFSGSRTRVSIEIAVPDEGSDQIEIEMPEERSVLLGDDDQEAQMGATPELTGTASPEGGKSAGVPEAEQAVQTDLEGEEEDDELLKAATDRIASRLSAWADS